ncbi:MAG: DNA polymerase III subunit delta [Bacillales bacterium]
MIYVIYGKDSALIKTKIKLLKNKIIKNEEEYEIIKLDGEEITDSDLLQECNSYSLMFNKKFIIVNNSFFLTSAKKTKKIKFTDKTLKFLQNLNEDVVLLFTFCGEYKINSSFKITKLIQEKGNILECKNLTSQQWNKYIKESFKKVDIKISDEAVNEFSIRIDNNFDIFNNEFNKLIALDKKIINKDDVINITSKSLNDDIFSFIDNLLINNKDKSLEILQNLIDLKVEPVGMIFLLTRAFIYYDMLIYLNDVKKANYKDIASITGYPIFAVLNSLKILKKVNKNCIKKALSDLYELDRAIKHLEIDPNYGLEMFIINFCL